MTAAEKGFFGGVRAALVETEPESKLRMLPSLAAQAETLGTPGERRAPASPEAPAAPAGGHSGLAGLAVLAMNLSLDCACRFRGLPGGYYREWLGCAIAMGRAYRRVFREPGPMVAEQVAEGLWLLVDKTGHDVLVRMALAPRLLAANMDGYASRHDLRPGSRAARAAASPGGALRAEAALILGTGDCWFAHACRERGIEPGPCLARLLNTYTRGEQRERIRRLGLAAMAEPGQALPPFPA